MITQFIPLILICHLDISSQKCNEETAITRTVGEAQNTPMACLINGQTKIASLAFAPKPDEPYYVKVKCVVQQEEK